MPFLTIWYALDTLKWPRIRDHLLGLSFSFYSLMSAFDGHNGDGTEISNAMGVIVQAGTQMSGCCWEPATRCRGSLMGLSRCLALKHG
jgi:hypothetical protein